MLLFKHVRNKVFWWPSGAQRLDHECFSSFTDDPNWDPCQNHRLPFQNFIVLYLFQTLVSFLETICLRTRAAVRPDRVGGFVCFIVCCCCVFVLFLFFWGCLFFCCFFYRTGKRSFLTQEVRSLAAGSILSTQEISPRWLCKEHREKKQNKLKEKKKRNRHKII